MPIKRLAALTAAFLFAFVLSACGFDQVDLSDYPLELEECAEIPENLDENITLHFVDGTLTPEGATVVLENNSDEPFLFGGDYQICFIANGKAYWIPYRGGWLLEEHCSEPHDSYTWEEDWSWMVGSLPAGQYLYVLSPVPFPEGQSQYCVVCEFEIT